MKKKSQPDQDAKNALLIEQLEHSSSAKRRSAAKALRKAKLAEAGKPLLEALIKEVDTPKTWETQYHIIMALAECNYEESLPMIREITFDNNLEPMVYIALGDAMIRLTTDGESRRVAILNLLKTKNLWLLEGGLRATAMLRLYFDEYTTKEIISYISTFPVDHHLRFWTAAACAGWNQEITAPFLNECLSSANREIQKASAASLKREYLKWSPL